MARLRRELTELARLRTRLVREAQERVNQLHRAVDLTFPEFTRHVKTLDSALALTLLARHPTARALAQVAPGKLARLVYDGEHRVGDALARALVAAAKASVGAHHTEAYARQARYGRPQAGRGPRDAQGPAARARGRAARPACGLPWSATTRGATS